MSWKALNLTWHFVEQWAASKPHSEALVFQDERLTWGDFKARMDAVAKAFLEIGVQKGDRVAMLSMARPEFLITYMAANKIGAVWLGLSPKFSLDELRYLIADAAPTVLITLRHHLGNDLAEIITALGREFDCLKKILVLGDPVTGTASFSEFVAQPRPAFTDDLERRASAIDVGDEALLMYTSGSTGKPKGVLHTHQSIIENIRVEIPKFHFKETTRGLLHFPINHVAADVEIGFAAIMGGGALVMLDKFDPAEVLKIIARERITVLGQVPVMYLLEFKQGDFFSTDFSSIEGFMWAGAAAPKIMIDVLDGLCRQTGAHMITGYGSTEMGGFITYTAKGDDLETLMKSAGKVAEPFELKIVDENRRELPDGEIGEIAVRGPFLMKGYFNRPDLTAAVIDGDGWHYTSDLAYRDARGYIYITGRRSEMFKTGGENVYPREIEDVIESHDSVLFAAVMGVPDEIYQEVGWAYVMPMPGKAVTEAELQSLCRAKLANFKLPKRFIIRDLLPLLASGKVDKLALRQEIEATLKKL